MNNGFDLHAICYSIDSAYAEQKCQQNEINLSIDLND